MALTISAPVAVASTTSGAATTGSFTPVINDTYLVMATGGASTSTAVTIAITDTQGGTWGSALIQANLTAPGGSGGGGVTGMWKRVVASGTAMTVTATATGGTPNSCGLQVIRLQAISLQFGTPNRGAASTASITPAAFTSTVAGSSLLATTSEWSGAGTLTSSDLTFTTYTNANMEGGFGYKTLGGIGAQTFQQTLSAGGNLWYWTAVEVWDAGTTVVNDGAPLATQGSGPYTISNPALLPGMPAMIDPFAQGSTVFQRVEEFANAYAGLSATANSVKVAPVTATASIGLAASDTAVKVGRPTTLAALALAARGTEVKVGTPSARSILGLVGRDTAAKVSTPAARSTAGLVGRDTAAKVSTPSATGLLGLAATGSTKAFRGVALAGLSATSTAVHVVVASARSALGLSGTAGARKVAPETAQAAVGLLATDTAVHVGTPAARSELGLVGRSAAPNKTVGSIARAALGLVGRDTSVKVSTPSATSALGLLAAQTISSRAAQAVASLGASAWAMTTKLATGTTARSALGLVGRDTAAKVASTTTGRSVLGLAARDTAAKVSTPSARSVLGAVASGAARKVAATAGRALAGMVGTAGSRKVASGPAAASLGLVARTTAARVASTTAVSRLGLSASGSLAIVRSAVARASLGLSGAVRELFHIERSRPGGWASLEAILEEERDWIRSVNSEPALACPYCGEPLIGNLCIFDAIHLAQRTPPVLTEETMPTDPGPWESLVSILRDAGDNALIEQQTPPIACPRCGEPLVSGHCTFDGYQAGITEDL